MTPVIITFNNTRGKKMSITRFEPISNKSTLLYFSHSLNPQKIFVGTFLGATQKIFEEKIISGYPHKIHTETRRNLTPFIIFHYFRM